MARLSWNAPSERFFELGLDRGVLYPKNVPPGPIDATNLAVNPRAAIGAGLGLWYGAAGGGGVTNAESFAYGGWNNLPYRTQIWTTAPTSENYLQRIFIPQVMSVTPGEIISVGLQTWRNSTKSSQMLVTFMLNGAYITSVGSAYAGKPANVWSLLKCENMTVPAGVNQMSVSFYAGVYTNVAVGDRISATALQISRSVALSAYHDGILSDGLHTQEWLGDPNNSVSIRRLIEGTAVAWNGLTSVEEAGADEATAYYIDGRPFLYFPNPKDFSGTLSAYMYPDEFAKITGLVEVDAIEGMYLGSQVGDLFDLSYRTLVGNGEDGQDHAYKIHLIYNAVAAPQGSAYETLNDSISPATFSWELTAVPVAIEGYRPTAHIVIDTRNMTAEHLANLEQVLYGDNVTAPSMPDPIDIMELLTFGDSIIITDNGDGTWSAEGPRSRVYMVTDDVFEIDGVEMTDFGNGTFSVSTTIA